MTIQQLEYIVALDTHRHFVSASEKCFVTQPTLTMQVQKLEEEIGVKIFNRSKKPLKPTKAGKVIIEKARQILREVNHLKEFVTDEKETLNGTFRIAIIPTLAPYLLPLFTALFKERNPETRLIIKEMQTEEIIRGINNDSLDLGILVTPLLEKTIREIPLFKEPFLVYHQNEESPFMKIKKLKVGMLEPDKMLILDEGHCFREQALNICKKRKKNNPNLDYQSGSIETLKRLADKGMGYTLIPELSLEEKDKDHIIRFEDPEPAREVSLATHNSFSKEKLIEELRYCILNNIPEHFSKNEAFIRVKWR